MGDEGGEDACSNKAVLLIAACLPSLYRSCCGPAAFHHGGGSLLACQQRSLFSNKDYVNIPNSILQLITHTYLNQNILNVNMRNLLTFFFHLSIAPPACTLLDRYLQERSRTHHKTQQKTTAFLFSFPASMACSITAPWHAALNFSRSK